MNISEQRVREYAHQIWESEGRPDGHAHRHWEMATKLAAKKDTQPAPEHVTVINNDSDIINKPKKAKAKALKKTLAETEEDSAGFTQSDAPAPRRRAAQASASTTSKSTQSLDGTAKTSRGKKAKVLKDTLETEMPKI